MVVIYQQPVPARNTAYSVDCNARSIELRPECSLAALSDNGAKSVVDQRFQVHLKNRFLIGEELLSTSHFGSTLVLYLAHHLRLDPPH